jgi:hypothetical protein
MASESKKKYYERMLITIELNCFYRHRPNIVWNGEKAIVNRIIIVKVAENNLLAAVKEPTTVPFFTYYTIELIKIVSVNLSSETVQKLRFSKFFSPKRAKLDKLLVSRIIYGRK